MNSLERYQNELIVMALLVGQQDEIINDIKEQLFKTDKTRGKSREFIGDMG